MLNADKEHTACFTGHRIIDMPEQQLEKKVFLQIKSAIIRGFTHFICGGAIGFDTICAKQVVFLRHIYKEITLEIALPCKDHDKNWSNKQKCRLNAILEVANKVKFVSETEHKKGCEQERNIYMIEKSNLVISYFTGRNSGTKNTIDYANKKEIKIIFINT